MIATARAARRMGTLRASTAKNSVRPAPKSADHLLHRKFLEVHERKEERRFDGPVSGRRGLADYHDRGDLERMRPASGHAELRSLDISHIGHNAGIRIVLLGVDSR